MECDKALAFYHITICNKNAQKTAPSIRKQLAETVLFS